LTKGTTIGRTAQDRLELHRGGKVFLLHWHGDGVWELHVEDSAYSVSYGLLTPCSRLVWRCRGQARRVWLEVFLRPRELAQRGGSDGSGQD
jgi:hypothetical protein